MVCVLVVVVVLVVDCKENEYTNTKRHNIVGKLFLCDGIVVICWFDSDLMCDVRRKAVLHNVPVNR